MRELLILPARDNWKERQPIVGWLLEGLRAKGIQPRIVWKHYAEHTEHALRDPNVIGVWCLEEVLDPLRAQEYGRSSVRGSILGMQKLLLAFEKTGRPVVPSPQSLFLTSSKLYVHHLPKSLFVPGTQTFVYGAGSCMRELRAALHATASPSAVIKLGYMGDQRGVMHVPDVTAEGVLEDLCRKIAAYQRTIGQAPLCVIVQPFLADMRFDGVEHRSFWIRGQFCGFFVFGFSARRALTQDVTLQLPSASPEARAKPKLPSEPFDPKKLRHVRIHKRAHEAMQAFTRLHHGKVPHMLRIDVAYLREGRQKVAYLNEIENMDANWYLGFPIGTAARTTEDFQRKLADMLLDTVE